MDDSDDATKSKRRNDPGIISIRNQYLQGMYETEEVRCQIFFFAEEVRCQLRLTAIFTQVYTSPARESIIISFL